MRRPARRHHHRTSLLLRAAIVVGTLAKNVLGEFQILLQDGAEPPTSSPLPLIMPIPPSTTPPQQPTSPSPSPSPLSVAAPSPPSSSDAPSDVPSTSPSLPLPTIPSLVPTVSSTFPPTSIPICPQEWTTYRNCFQDRMPTSAAENCDQCVGASLPDQRDSTCQDYSIAICTALNSTCDCQPCTDDIELYFQCTYDELGLTCPLDCGSTPSLTEPSSAPSTTMQPNGMTTNANFSNSDNNGTTSQSTSGASVPWRGLRKRLAWAATTAAATAILTGGVLHL